MPGGETCVGDWRGLAVDAEVREDERMRRATIRLVIKAMSLRLSPQCPQRKTSIEKTRRMSSAQL